MSRPYGQVVSSLSFWVKADGREEQMRPLGFMEAQLAQGPIARQFKNVAIRCFQR